MLPKKTDFGCCKINKPFRLGAQLYRSTYAEDGKYKSIDNKSNGRICKLLQIDL